MAPSAGSCADALLADVEARFISSTLDRTGGNITTAARMMGIGRNTLYRKLRGLNGPDLKDLKTELV
jgi:transcriptional regulator of acetoin/glycerol metabolism